jgi:hypothetical protein
MTPDRWHFLIGLPTTIDEWRACRQNARAFDFHRQADSEKSFEKRIGRPMRDQLALLQRIGCTVSRCNFGDLAGAFKDFHVVTLIAHWDPLDRVELADGLHDWSKITNAIPPSFGGIIDLCVCHPDSMVRHLDATRPRNLIKYKPREPSEIILWLGAYGVMAAMMNERPTPFTDALVGALRILGKLDLIASHKEEDVA